MGQVWKWAFDSPVLTTVIVLVLIACTFQTIITISNHLTIGWKSFCAIFTRPPTIINEAQAVSTTTDEDEDEDDDEDEDEAPVPEAPPVPTLVEGVKPPTRFDRINNS